MVKKYAVQEKHSSGAWQFVYDLGESAGVADIAEYRWLWWATWRMNREQKKLDFNRRWNVYYGMEE